MKPRFEVWESARKTQPWFYRLLGKNGEIVCQSEGYATRSSAKRAIKRLAAIAAAAVLTACASTAVEYVPFEVKVPVPVPCAAEVPAEPVWETSKLRKGDDLLVKVRALLAELFQRQGYEAKLRAAIDGCR